MRESQAVNISTHSQNLAASRLALIICFTVGACSGASGTSTSKQTVERDKTPEAPNAANASNHRTGYVAGMSFAVPARVKVAYPQGIDSSILHISGDGFQIATDSYGAYSGSGDRPARLTERAAPSCRERVWEVELPVTNPTMMHCPPHGRPDQCTHPLGHALISVRCTNDASCQTAQSIIESARFAPQPWPALPKTDVHWQPPAPECKFADE